MPPSLTPVDVNPTSITAAPAPAAITYHDSVATIPVHITSGTNNGYESNSSDGILETIDTGSTPAETVALSYLCDIINNALSRAQGYPHEKVAVAGSPNTLSATLELSFIDSTDWTTNEILSRL